MADLGFIFLNFLRGNFKKGPPEAVIITSSILVFVEPFNKDQIEKCSESIGINFVLYFNNFFLN